MVVTASCFRWFTHRHFRFLSNGRSGRSCPNIPWVTERKLLARIENLFRLFYELLRELGPRSLAKTKVAYWLEELDEQLDSLEFVREYGADLDATIAEVRSHHTQQNHG